MSNPKPGRTIEDWWRIYWNDVFKGNGQPPTTVTDDYAKQFAVWFASQYLD